MRVNNIITFLVEGEFILTVNVKAEQQLTGEDLMGRFRNAVTAWINTEPGRTAWVNSLCDMTVMDAVDEGMFSCQEFHKLGVEHGFTYNGYNLFQCTVWPEDQSIVDVSKLEHDVPTIQPEKD